MSRIGNKPVSIVDGVTVSVTDGNIDIEGPKGKLSYRHRPEVSVAVEDGVVKVSRGRNDKNSRAFHGPHPGLGAKHDSRRQRRLREKNLSCRALVTSARVAGKQLKLRVGLANELVKDIPDGLDVTCPDQTHVDVKGCDKQKSRPIRRRGSLIAET